MADLLGRRPVFLAGLTLFTAASLASGLAPTPEEMIVSRAAQGLGAAMLSPTALSIITTTYSGAQRITALSAWGAIGRAGVAVTGAATGFVSRDEAVAASRRTPPWAHRWPRSPTRRTSPLPR
jgi:MFS family permease